MKLPQIETTTITDQFKKIKSEYHECKYEFEQMGNISERDNAEITKSLQLEALDLLTATFNLVKMLKIPQSVIEEWEEKMKNYETEKGYKIINWWRLESGNNASNN